MSHDVTVAFIAEAAERFGGVPAAEVRPESAFSDLGIDSLSMMEIVVAAEDRFGVRIVDDDVAAFRTVSDVVGYIEQARVPI